MARKHKRHQSAGGKRKPRISTAVTNAEDMRKQGESSQHQKDKTSTWLQSTYPGPLIVTSPSSSSLNDKVHAFLTKATTVNSPTEYSQVTEDCPHVGDNDTLQDWYESQSGDTIDPEATNIISADSHSAGEKESQTDMTPRVPLQVVDEKSSKPPMMNLTPIEIDERDLEYLPNNVPPQDQSSIQLMGNSSEVDQASIMIGTNNITFPTVNQDSSEPLMMNLTPVEYDPRDYEHLTDKEIAVKEAQFGIHDNSHSADFVDTPNSSQPFSYPQQAIGYDPWSIQPSFVQHGTPLLLSPAYSEAGGVFTFPIPNYDMFSNPAMYNYEAESESQRLPMWCQRLGPEDHEAAAKGYSYALSCPAHHPDASLWPEGTIRVSCTDPLPDLVLIDGSHCSPTAEDISYEWCLTHGEVQLRLALEAKEREKKELIAEMIKNQSWNMEDHVPKGTFAVDDYEARYGNEEDNQIQEEYVDDYTTPGSEQVHSVGNPQSTYYSGSEVYSLRPSVGPRQNQENNYEPPRQAHGKSVAFKRDTSMYGTSSFEKAYTQRLPRNDSNRARSEGRRPRHLAVSMPSIESVISGRM